MLEKFTHILLFWLTSFFISFWLYPRYINLLQKFKAWKQIREDTMTWEKSTIFASLHAHKSGTPTMGWGLMLLVVALLIISSFLLQEFDIINNTLINRNETYILLFALFSMWILWLVDDIFNIKGKSRVKWLTAKMKILWMFLFSAWVSWWFYSKLGIDYINIWPLLPLENAELSLWLFLPIISFFFTVGIVNAINITDWLDGLAWWLSLLVLWVLWIVTFISQRYLATTIIWIVIWSMIAFLWYNINPARIFMWDSWSLALWWLIATLVYLINIKIWIVIPFIILFLLFRIEIWSSMFQIFRKKVFKRKLFIIAPFHHLLEKKWMKEHTIVMRFRLIQSILTAISLVMFFYQIQG